MSSTELIAGVVCAIIGVLTIVGVLVFIVWLRCRQVNQRLTDEEVHPFGDRIGFRQPSSTQQALRFKAQVPSILDYGLILPPRLTVSLSQSGQYFPILLPKLSTRVHINPHFKKGEWMDEFDFESLNITRIMYHREISEETLEPFKGALPLHEIQNKEPKLLLEEVKQISRSLA